MIATAPIYKSVHICNHNHVGLSVHAKLKQYDPTHTTMLRKAFVTDLNKRFARLRGDIRRLLVDQDFLGLRDRQELPAIKTHSFTFKTSAEKVDGFMEWLQGQVDDNLLQVRKMPQYGKGVQKSWTDMYIEDSYERGIQRARYEMGKVGMTVPGIEQTGGIHTSMGMPMHMDRVGLLYTRTYNELKNITNEMSNQLSKVLSKGMIDGDGPAVIARKINKTISGPVGDLGMTDTLGRFIPAQRRAQIMARTEIIRAHHHASVQEYRNWGVAGVKVEVEFRTAGDDRVCKQCAKTAAKKLKDSLHTRIYTLDEIEDMIPVHPQCRCMALPVNPEDVPSKYDIKKPAPKPAPKAKVKPNTPQFKSKKHQELYDDFEKEAQKFWNDFEEMVKKKGGIVDQEMWNLFKQGTIHEIDQTSAWLSANFSDAVSKFYAKLKTTTGIDFKRGFQKWQGSTRMDFGESLRYTMLKMEVPPPGQKVGQVFKNYTEVKRFFQEGGNIIDEQSYIRLRAFNQVYMRQVKGMKAPIRLIRGTDGRTGKEINARILYELDMKRTTHRMDDNILVGYTDSYDTAKKFGHGRHGVTVEKQIELDDIFLHKDLLSGVTMDYENEREYIVRGFSWNVKKGEYVLSDNQTLGWGSESPFESLWQAWMKKYLY